jgi:hypothetical protein
MSSGPNQKLKVQNCVNTDDHFDMTGPIASDQTKETVIHVLMIILWTEKMIAVDVVKFDQHLYKHVIVWSIHHMSKDYNVPDKFWSGQVEQALDW